jgi:hypothetical protein
MKKTNNPPPTNFWFGFALGTLAATGLGYLFGTKKGRETLTQMVKFSENLPENLEHLLDEHHAVSSKSENKLIDGLHTIEGVINKIKDTAEGKNHQKFFIKEEKK